MRTVLITISALLALASCEKKSEEATESKATPTEAEKKTDKAPVEVAGTKVEEPAEKSDELCGCRMLTKYSLEELEKGTHEKLCDGDKLLARFNCDQYDVMRNCIYAAYGYKFKKKRWQTLFATKDWYKPSGNFRESQIPKVATENIRALKTRASQCRVGAESKVTKADVKRVRDWYKNRQKQIPPIVWHEEGGLEDDPAKTIEARLDYFGMNDKTQFWYTTPSSDELALKLYGKDFRTISVGDCFECDEDTEDELACGTCDIFEIMLGKNNEVVALYLTVASACPFVYAAAKGQPLRLQGEILRQLRASSLEGRQRLALDTPCDESIAVRLAEHKPEITFLDEVYLEVDGARINPASCSSRQAYCSDDGQYHRLEPDDVLDLTFEVERSSCQSVSLVADGYYIPL